MLSSRWLRLGLLLGVVALGLLLFASGAGQYIEPERFGTLLRELGIWGPVLYVVLFALLEPFGVLGIVGLCMVVWRRGVQRPARLHSVMDDWFALALLLLIFLQGFFVEGVRIAVTELEQQPELASWSPGGTLVALSLRPKGEA